MPNNKLATSKIQYNEALHALESEPDIYLALNTTKQIELKRFPALIVIRGSGNNHSAVLLAPSSDFSSLSVIYSSGVTLSQNSLSGNIATIKVSSSAIGYSVFY